MVAKKKEKKLSFETDEDYIAEETKFKFKPESIISLIAKDGLSDDFNPYGAGYMPELSKFLGDEEPFEGQFRADGSRRWEKINEGDSDITPIYFSMPTPPKDLTKIDNYELPPDEQYFRRITIPEKFKKIEKRALTVLEEIEKKNRQDTIQGYKFYLKFWEIFDQEIENLEEEIIWLKKVWWCRTYGYWYYNDGEPTFLPPDYFDFLCFYYISEAECYPEYRDDRRRVYCFSRYLESCTETFKDINLETGKAIKNSEGKYDMVDLGRRLFFGDAEPKTRRKGNTHEAIHKNLKGATTNYSFFSTIISFEGNNAEIHYKKKLLPAFDAIPMCLKPMWEGNRRPTILRLDTPPNVYIMGGLKSAITFSDSGGLFKNEGDRLNGLLNDEQGKSSSLNINIFERWNVNKFTMSTGLGINILKGVYVKNPSTVEEMESASAPYYRMCMMSDFYRRVPIKGQTVSGFARIFIKAYLAMEGFIDRFGKSVVETPTERQIRLSPQAIFAVAKKGCRQMMQEERDSLIAENTPQSLETYRSIRRKSPFAWAECWLGSSGSVGYNLEIIDKRLAEINRMRSFSKPPYKVGYYYREKGGQFDAVRWMTDLDKPKFRVSMELPEELTNRMTMTEVWDYSKNKFVPSWSPVEGYKFTLGADSFRNINKNDAKTLLKTGGSMSNSRQSDGGIAINWEYDESIDGGKPKRDWETDRVILTYRWRPATWEEYVDDVIMAAQYWGAMIYPEFNVEAIVRDIYAKGYGGFFIFDLDTVTGKPKPMPGVYTTPGVLQEMMVDAKDYIEFHGHKENHDDLLLEFKNLKGIEDFTHKDLHVAFGMARKGSKSRYRNIIMQGTGESFAIDGLF
jgi:hypothetical protein